MTVMKDTFSMSMFYCIGRLFILCGMYSKGYNIMRIPMYGGERLSRKKRRGILRRPNGQSRRRRRVRFNPAGINDSIARFFPEGKSLKIFGGNDEKKEQQKKARAERRKKEQEERDAKQAEDTNPVEKDDADQSAVEQMAAAAAIIGEEEGNKEDSDDKKAEGIDDSIVEEDAQSAGEESKQDDVQSVDDRSDRAGGDDADDEESVGDITIEENGTEKGGEEDTPSSVSSVSIESVAEDGEEAEQIEQDVGVQATTSTVDASTSMDGDIREEYTDVPKGDTEALDAALGGTLLVKEGDKYYIGELYHSKLPEEEKKSYPPSFLKKTHFSVEDVNIFFDNYHACKTFKNENLVQRCYPMRSLMIAISANMYYKYYVELIQIKNIEEEFVKGNAKGMYKYLRSYADSIPQTQKALEKLGLIDPTVEEGITKIHRKAEDLLDHLRRDAGVPVPDEAQGGEEGKQSISIRERISNIRGKKNKVHPDPATRYSGPAPTPIAAEDSPVSVAVTGAEKEDFDIEEEDRKLSVAERVRKEQASVPIPTANGASKDIDGKGTGISTGIAEPESEGPAMEGAIGVDGVKDGLSEGEQNGLLSAAVNAEGSGEQIDMEELRSTEETSSVTVAPDDVVLEDVIADENKGESKEETDRLLDGSS